MAVICKLCGYEKHIYFCIHDVCKKYHEFAVYFKEYIDSKGSLLNEEIEYIDFKDLLLNEEFKQSIIDIIKTKQIFYNRNPKIVPDIYQEAYRNFWKWH